MAQTLAERMRWAIARAGVTQAELAQYCKVSKPTVNDWLSGKTKTLKADSALLAAKKLGVDPLWLSAGSGSPATADPKGEAPVKDAAALRLDRLLRQLYTYPPEVIKAALAEIGLQPPAPSVPTGGHHVEGFEEFLEGTTGELAERRYERERRQAEEAAEAERRRRDRRGA